VASICVAVVSRRRDQRSRFLSGHGGRPAQRAATRQVASVAESRVAGHMRDRAWFQDHTRGFQPSNHGSLSVCGLTVCKTVGSAYVGSNPTPATRVSPDISTDLASQDLARSPAKAAVLPTVVFVRADE
jgi:hypothetical protein